MMGNMFWVGVITSVTLALSSFIYLKFRTNNNQNNIEVGRKKLIKETNSNSSPATNNKRAYEPPKLDISKEGITQDLEKTRSKDSNALPISVDIPRLAKNFKIYDKNGVELFDGAKVEENHEDQQTVRIHLIYQLLETLYKLYLQNKKLIHSKRGQNEDEGDNNDKKSDCEIVNNNNNNNNNNNDNNDNNDNNNNEQLQIFKEKFDEMVDVAGDVSIYLRQFFNLFLPNDHFVTSLLKVCNQSILAAVVIRMKCSLGESYPYKDQRGRWFILVHLPYSLDQNDNEKDDDDDVSNKHIVITHRKEEVSWDDGMMKNPFIKFNFTWELRMRFDYQMKELIDVKIAIVDFQILEETPDERLQLLHNCILSSCSSFLQLESNFFDKFK